MHVFITGIDGYIGCVLAPRLMARGHEVSGLDSGFYRRGWLYTPHDVPSAPKTIFRDLRHLQPRDLDGVDCVVHLGELSNDPLSELQPDVTIAINHGATMHLAVTAKAAGIARFVYASSCSVYGAASDEWCTEHSPTNPQTTYARCKVFVERDVGAMADEHFSPVFLRNATAYGASPRMRFDIVLNNLAGLARTTGEIRLNSDGTPWRPLVHVRDICRAITCAVEAPRETVHAETFNIGADDQNYRVGEIAELVREAFPECPIVLGSASADTRSYRVSFDKARRQLPGFACEWTGSRGARELREIFDRIGLTRERFMFPAFTRIEEVKYLLETRQVDDHLFWTH